MDDIPPLPPVFVVSAASQDEDHRLRSATMACRQAERGAVAFSTHWGPAEILVEAGDGATSWARETSITRQTRDSASLALAARATEVLRTAGLLNCSTPVVSPQSLDLKSPKRPPVIRVSIPAHFGVELMVLAGAVLRPLHDSRVMLMGLCGTIDAALRDRFDSGSLDDLKRYGDQLPKHRVRDLYPLFCLIGARSGVARGVLDHVLTERTIEIRHAWVRPGRLGARAPRPPEHETVAGVPSPSMKRRHG
jgi:hypothetical protein